MTEVTPSEVLIRNTQLVLARHGIDISEARDWFLTRKYRNAVRIVDGAKSDVRIATREQFRELFEHFKITVVINNLFDAEFESSNRFNSIGFGVVEKTFKDSFRQMQSKAELFLDNKREATYYLISEGRRNYGESNNMNETKKYYVRDFKLKLSQTGDLFEFTMNSDFREKISYQDDSFMDAYPIFTGNGTLFHSSLCFIGACQDNSDVEPMTINCFMTELTPYCFFGVQNGSLRVPKTFYSRKVAFVRAYNYDVGRLGFKDWEDLDARLKKWIREEKDNRTYLLSEFPPGSIFATGADKSYKF